MQEIPIKPDRLRDIIGKRHPEWLELDGPRATVGGMVFMEAPPIRRLAPRLELGEVPSLNLGKAKTRHIVIPRPQMGPCLQIEWTGFLAGFPEHRDLRRLILLNGARRNLDTGLGTLWVAEDQEPVAPGDVSHDLLGYWNPPRSRFQPS